MPTQNESLLIELDGIGHALSDHKLVVPVYQRSYAWEEKHVNDLITDLFSSIRDGEYEYFIGSIVISLNDGKHEVVDGQQRLATISILIAAMRDYFEESGDKQRASHLQGEYLSKVDRRSQEVIPSLTLNNSDHEFYYSQIILTGAERKSIPAQLKQSHGRILKAYQIAGKAIKSYVANTTNPTDTLLDLLDYIDKNLKIIWVQVPDHANAYTIFETLNDRGLDLAISDLLKNFLFGQSDNRIGEVSNFWTEMYSRLENIENEALVVTFIRHYWSSINGLTRERELYSKIKKSIVSKQKAVDLAANLASASKIYVALIDSSQTFWDEYPDESKTAMSSLNMFGMVQVRPLLLAVFTKFKKAEIEETLKFLVSASVRFLIHGGLGGGALETQYSERAKEITNGNITTAKDLKTKMAKAIPTDAEFETSFKNAVVSKAFLARYYLQALEKSNKGDSKPELIPNTDTTAVNLEHVLPQSPAAAWGISDEEHKVLWNKIGNLALMSSKLNSDAGNDTFASKKAHFAKSSFELTRQIAQESKWTAKEIANRQDVLAKLAVKTWPVK